LGLLAVFVRSNYFCVQTIYQKKLSKTQAKIKLSDHIWSLVALYRFALVFFQVNNSAKICFCVIFCEYPYI